MNTEITTEFRQKLIKMYMLRKMALSSVVWCEECDILINLSNPNHFYEYNDNTGFYLCLNCCEPEDDSEDEDA